MKIRLTRKLAECINGIDLSHREVGDVFDVAERSAELLIAEGWAKRAESRRSPRQLRREAADAPRGPRKRR